MKKFLLATLVMGSLSAFAQDTQSAPVNMSDSLDKNIVPAEQEVRKNTEVPANLPDSVDRNTVPAPFEERQMQEEAIGTESDSMDEKSKQHQDEPVMDDQKMEDHSDHKMDSTESSDSM